MFTNEGRKLSIETYLSDTEVSLIVTYNIAECMQGLEYKFGDMITRISRPERSAEQICSIPRAHP